MNRLRERMTATLLIVIFMMSTIAVSAIAKKGGTTIQDGTLLDSHGDPLVLGFDVYGYNYQGHMFRGRYCDSDRVIGGAYEDVNLIMKWNDAWLSNMDREPDGDLDRHYGYTSYIGSGAWLTNHMWGVDNGIHWSYFTKIVAVPADAYLDGGTWYQADGTEIGPAIWGAFATILSVEQGILYHSPSPVGFGYYQP